jgi:hypothetical protein
MEKANRNPYRVIVVSLMKEGYSQREALGILSEVIVDQIGYDKMIDHWNAALDLAQDDQIDF